MKKKEINRTEKLLLTIAGFLCLGIGLIGILVPILPTTPFLLLAAGIFLRSSEKWYGWLMNHKALGPYVRNFQENKAIPLGAKIASITLLWGTIVFSIVFLIQPLWLKIALGCLAIAVSAHILHYKTLEKE